MVQKGGGGVVAAVNCFMQGGERIELAYLLELIPPVNFAGPERPPWRWPPKRHADWHPGPEQFPTWRLVRADVPHAR